MDKPCVSIHGHIIGLGLSYDGVGRGVNGWWHTVVYLLNEKESAVIFLVIS